MFNKLNGWQRLWVVFSAFLFLVFFFYAYQNFPHDYAFKEDGGVNLDPPECESVILHLKNEWIKSHKQADIFDTLSLYSAPEYQICRNKAKLKQQTTFVVRVFLVWLACVSFIYGAGFSVAWVRSGFRHKKE